MKKILLACAILLVMHVLNPDLDAHKSACMPQLDREVNEAYSKGNFITKLGLALGGEEFKSSFLNSLRRRDYVLFSLGYINGELVTIGALGYVHVRE